MCGPRGAEAIYTENGRRGQDGDFTSNSKLKPGERWADRPTRSTDVPLGDGMADAARLSILTRRDRIAEAVGD